MDNQFFERPILNSPYEEPTEHWELDQQGQPTQRLIHARRPAQFITPIPKPRKRKTAQQDLLLDEGEGISTERQQYATTSTINELRFQVEKWRKTPNANDWHVTPETARLLQHWRHHKFSGIRPFFCQVEAVETAIWLTEVAPKIGKTGERFLAHLANANQDANPDLMRLALKLATGAGKTTVMAMVIAWQTINAVRHEVSNFNAASPPPQAYYVDIDGAAPPPAFLARFDDLPVKVHTNYPNMTHHDIDNTTVLIHLHDVYHDGSDQARVMVLTHHAGETLKCGTPYPVPLVRTNGKWSAVVR